MRVIILCAAASAVAAITATPASADPQRPFVDTIGLPGTMSLPAWIESELQTMVSRCTGLPGTLTLTRGSNRKAATAVPLNLQQDLQFGQPRRLRIDSNGVDQLFGTIFTGDPRGNYDGTPRSQLAIVQAGNRIPMPLAGSNLVMYQADCDSSLLAAMSLDGNYTLPIASLKAALSARYRSAETYQVNLVQGDFVSPLRTALAQDNAGPSAIDPAAAAMAVWLWYQAVPNRAAQQHYLIDRFTGYALLRQATSTSEMRGTVSASGDARLFTIGASTNVEASAGTRSNLTSRLHSIGFNLSGDGRRIFEVFPLPSAESVAAVVQDQVRLTSAPESQTELFGTRRLQFLHTTTLVPQLHCGTSRWRVSTAGVDLDDVVFNPATGVCSFKSSYQPTQAVAANGEDLTLAFVRQFGDQPGTRDLTLRTPPLELRPQSAPAMTAAFDQGGSAKPEIGDIDAAANTPLTWRRTYTLSELPQASRRVESIEVEPLSIVCDGQNFLATAQAIVRPDRTVALTVRALAPYQVDPTEPQEVCQLSGQTIFGLANGNKVPKPFPLRSAEVYVPAPRRSSADTTANP